MLLLFIIIYLETDLNVGFTIRWACRTKIKIAIQYDEGGNHMAETETLIDFTPYNRLSELQMLSGTQIMSTSHGMTGRNFFDVFLPFYLLFGF